MRAIAVLMLTFAFAAPAQAQVPCGIVTPCPTSTPSPPDPTATPAPTATPDVPVTITLAKPPRIRSVDQDFQLRGRVTGAGEALRVGSVQLELVITSTHFDRSFAPADLFTDPDGRFALTVTPQTDAEYVVRAKAGAGLSGASAPRRVRAVASLDYYDARYSRGAHPSFGVSVEFHAPPALAFSDGVMSIGGFPRRVFLYAGRGRRLARVASARLRPLPANRGVRNARLRVSVNRLPRGRFRYQACFPGRGARGLTPAFVNCGARYFRAG